MKEPVKNTRLRRIKQFFAFGGNLHSKNKGLSFGQHDERRPQMKEHYLNEREVSELTGIAKQTLRNWRSRGCGIPYFKIGRAVRYSEQDIVSYFAEHRIEPARDHAERR